MQVESMVTQALRLTMCRFKSGLSKLQLHKNFERTGKPVLFFIPHLTQFAMLTRAVHLRRNGYFSPFPSPLCQYRYEFATCSNTSGPQSLNAVKGGA